MTIPEYAKGPTPDPTEIRKDIWLLKVPIPDNPLGFLQAYLIKGEDGCTLIDCGWNAPVAMEALEKHLSTLGLTWKDITRLIITHMHPDHFGLAAQVKELSGAKVTMYHRDINNVDTPAVDYRQMMKRMIKILTYHGTPHEDMSDLHDMNAPAPSYWNPVEFDEMLQDGQKLTAGQYTLEVIHTPGHAIEHICLYEPENKILFSGDHVLPLITPNIAINAYSSPNPLGDFVHSLDKVAKLDVDLALPGHEYIFSNFQERVAELQGHHVHRLHEIEEVMGGHSVSAYHIASQLKWNLAPWDEMGLWDKRMAMMEVLAHVEYLRLEGKVQHDSKDGKGTYSSVSSL
ncbi:MAG: MBL fold metallo-hydrolase [Bacillota bacterium]